MNCLALFLAAAMISGDESPASYWDFDQITDGECVDARGGLHASVSGATCVQGALHGALYFDGVDDHAAVTAIDDVRNSIGSFEEGTISAWFRFDHSPGFMDIETIFYLGAQQDFSEFGTSANCFQLEIGHFSAQRRLYWTMISTNGDVTDIPLCWSTTDQLTRGQWYHIVSTTSAEGTRVYLNSIELFDSSVLTWNFGDATKRRFLGDVDAQEVLWFGRGLWNDEQKYFEGCIDEVKIWDRAIAPEEVEAEFELAAGTGALEIDQSVPEELLATADLQLTGHCDNITELGWRVGDGTPTVQPVVTPISTWLRTVPATAVPAGRHVLTVTGRNAARRSFSDERIVVQPDLNADSMVNVLDLLQVISMWGDCNPCPEDLSGSGGVDIEDLLIILASWN